MLTQLVIAGLIFLLFLFAVFFTEAYNVRYLLILLIIANIVFLFVNKTKGLFVNILMFLITLSLGYVIIEYIASIFGFILSAYHGLRMLWQFKSFDKGDSVVIEQEVTVNVEKPKKKKK